MTGPGRVLCKLKVRTVADRRARRMPATVAPGQSEFTDDERQVFRGIDRRKRPATPRE
jgi:hypothetical protein